MRPFGVVTEEDINRELLAITSLYRDGNPENLVAVIDHGQLPESSYYYIDMELCAANLETYITSPIPLEFELGNPRLLGACLSGRGIWNTWDIMEQISNGIQFIHSRGKVHRDLKPRNGKSIRFQANSVLFSGKDKTWKVGDFGLTMEGTSKQLRSTLGGRGTACYRAPELLKERGKFNNKVDIFALGCILFELATCKKAFSHEFNVLAYAESPFELQIPHNDEDCIKTYLHDMLAVEDSVRPSASFLRTQFARNRWVALGNGCQIRKDHYISIKAYKLALQLDSTDPSILRRLGDSYKAINNYYDAIEAYRSAIDAGFAHHYVLADLGSCLYANGRCDEAILMYKQAIKRDPRDLRLFTAIGEVYLSTKDYDNAIKAYKKVANGKAPEAVAFEKLGEAYAAKGKHDRAIHWYKAGLRRFSSESLMRSLLEIEKRIANSIPTPPGSDTGNIASVKDTLQFTVADAKQNSQVPQTFPSSLKTEFLREYKLVVVGGGGTHPPSLHAWY